MFWISTFIVYYYIYLNKTVANSVYNQLLGISCEYYHFGYLQCIWIQNHFVNANDHTRERCAQAKRLI